jgi:hypothetical protein
MIDIETEIFNNIATRIRAEYNPVAVYGEHVRAPSVFPSIMVTESDNYPLERTQTSDSVENHVVLVYEINVYSNKQAGKKSECKAIFKLVDEEMSKMGFTRTSLNPIPNLEDATIYRMVGRYRAVVSTDKKIFRR